MQTPTIQANLQGKVALVTGASQGLGRYQAEVLARNGAHVVVAGRSIDKLKAVASKIGEKAFPMTLDTTHFDSFDQKIRQIKAQFGSLDILINNAAISSDKDIFGISETDWDSHINTNLKGVFFLSQAVAKHMKTQENGGCIINIAAINGDHVRKNCIPFSVSKAGVIHLTKLMAYELIPYKIRVNAISLGLFASESVQEWLESDPKAQDYLAQIPVKRAGQLQDLDGPILLLTSDASAYMYGTIIKVDGGFAIDRFLDLDIHHEPA